MVKICETNGAKNFQAPPNSPLFEGLEGLWGLVYGFLYTPKNQAFWGTAYQFLDVTLMLQQKYTYIYNTKHLPEMKVYHGSM